MSTDIKYTNVEAAIEDLKSRTLSGIPGEVARLVYLASTRDYNTGEYYHEGVAIHFTEDVARAALAACHQESFRRLLFTSLEDLVKELDNYVNSTGARPAHVMKVWRSLEPYRVTIPLESDQLSAQLFLSNLRVALAILQARQQTGRDSQQCA